MKKIIRYTLIDYHIKIINNKLKFTPFFDELNRENGFYFYEWESDNVIIFLHASVVDEKKFKKFLLRLDKNPREEILNSYEVLKEIFQLYVWDKRSLTFFTLVDYLGIGTNYYVRDKKSIIFFSNFKNIFRANIKLQLNIQNLYHYLSFGYQVYPFKLPYENVIFFRGRYLKIFKENKEFTIEVSIDNKAYNPNELVEDLKIIYKEESLNNKLFFGTTSGKDSLVLMSLIPQNHSYISGNFGNLLSADVIQGKELSKVMKVPYNHVDNCTSNEFTRYTNMIAQVSGGLTTCSYVDMLKFVSVGIPKGYSYVMGEGGECIRDFFSEKTISLEMALDNYITPNDYLRTGLKDKTLNVEILKEELIETINHTYKGKEINEVLLEFYRFGRMPGNFSNRTKLISVYRNKVSPFLNINFIKRSYYIDKINYENSGIHRRLIKSVNSKNLDFFDYPIKSITNTQNWESRIKGDIGKEILKIISSMSNKSEEVFDKKGLIIFTKNQINTPNRGLYFILKVISFILFIDNNKENITILKIND